MNAHTCCFTGHRELPAEDLPLIKARLFDTVAALAKEGVTTFKNGGALGFDKLAAFAVIKLKEANPAVRLEMVLPHKKRTANHQFGEINIRQRAAA